MTISGEFAPARGNHPGMERTGARPSPEQLYDEHVSYVFWVVARLGVGPNDHEDMVNEVFIAAFKALDRFDPSRAVRPWLHGIAFHVCDHWHKQRREVPVEDIERGADASAGPEARLAAKRELCILLGAVPLDRRVVLTMHDGDGCSMAEIVRELAIPLSTGYKRLEKAREELAAAVARQQARERTALGVLPIPFDVAAFLADHRDVPEAPASARGRVRSSLRRSLADAVPNAAPRHALPAKVARAAGRYLASQLPGAIVGAVGGGVIVYVLLHEPPAPPPLRPTAEVAVVDPQRGASASAVLTGAPSAERAPTLPAATAPVMLSATSSLAPPAFSATPGLDGEALLLQRARWFYAHHDLKAAREALDLHAATYPNGRLAHARETLRRTMAAPATPAHERFGTDEQ